MGLIIIWLAFGIVTALAAQARGRNFFAWLVIGCLTGIFGLIAVLVMENQNRGSGS
jgi:predicted outer membrane lipoprotein